MQYNKSVIDLLIITTGLFFKDFRDRVKHLFGNINL